jgi:hypothetical protein
MHRISVEIEKKEVGKNYELFAYAVLNDEYEQVESFLKEGYDPNTIIYCPTSSWSGGEEKLSCLSIACRRNKREMAECLVEYGADIHFDFQQAILQAGRSNNIDLVRYLLEKAGYCENKLLSDFFYMLATSVAARSTEQKNIILQIIDICFFYGAGVGYDFSKKFFEDAAGISQPIREPWEQYHKYFEGKIILGAIDVQRLKNYKQAIYAEQQFWSNIEKQDYAHWHCCLRHIQEKRPTLAILATILKRLDRAENSLKERCRDFIYSSLKSGKTLFFTVRKIDEGKSEEEVCPTLLRPILNEERNSPIRFNLFYDQAETVNPVLAEDLYNYLFTQPQHFSQNPKKMMNEVKNLLYSKAVEFYKKGNYVNAIPYFQLVLDYQILDNKWEHSKVADAYYNLARCYKNMGEKKNMLEAAYLFQQAAKIYENVGTKYEKQSVNAKNFGIKALHDAGFTNYREVSSFCGSIEQIVDYAYFKKKDLYTAATSSWTKKERSLISDRLQNRGVHMLEYQLRESMALEEKSAYAQILPGALRRT